MPSGKQAISALVAAGSTQLFDNVSATPQPTGARYTPSSASNSTVFSLVQAEFSPCDEILHIFMLPNENTRKYLAIAHARTTHVHAPASATVCRLDSFPRSSLERFYRLSPSIAQRLRDWQNKHSHIHTRAPLPKSQKFTDRSVAN